MNCLFFCDFILLAISAFCTKRKYIHSNDGDQFPKLAKIAQGSFVKHVTEWSKKEISAAVKFWRVKGKFKIKDGVLKYTGKKVSLVITSF